MPAPARPYWTGFLKLSLVTIGVRLYTATTERDKVRFHMIHEPSGERVKQQLIVPGIGPVEREDIVKGYEYEKGRYINVDPDDIKRLRLETTDTIDVTEFVEDIDPIYFDTPYYLVPDGSVAEEGYRVIREALRESGKIALGRVVINGQERIIALRPLGTGLLGNSVRYPDEIRRPEDYFGSISADAVDEDQLAIMQQIIARRSRDFDPSQFVDRYQAALRELIEEKLEGRLPAKEPERRPAQVINLMDALKRSLAAEEGKKAEAAASAGRRARLAPDRVRRGGGRRGSGAAPARAKAASRGRKPATPPGNQRNLLLPVSGGAARDAARPPKRRRRSEPAEAPAAEAPQARLSGRALPCCRALFVLGLDRAFVPAAQQQPRQEVEQPVNDDAGQRQQQQRREHARDRQPVAGFEYAEGQPGLGSAGPGDKLGHDRADQRQTAADPQPGEEIGQRRRDSQIAQCLPR